MHMKLNFKRLMAVLLSIMMIVGMMPMSVFAEEETETSTVMTDPVTESQTDASEQPIVITYNDGTGITIGTNENSTLSEALDWFYTLMSMTTTEVYSLEITINGDITDTDVAELKYNTTISGTGTLTNVRINAVEGCDSLTVSGLTFGGDSWINSGAAETLVVSDVTADVTPVNGNGTANNMTNSRSAFISLGSSEQHELALTVEDCKIVSGGGSDPILGWAAITSADITGNTFGSASTYQENSDSVKFMSVADEATFEFTNNTVYSNYNGIVIAQNTTRDNSYTANFDGNTFMGNADHIWLELTQNNTFNGNINVKSNNTINGNTVTVDDIKTYNANGFSGYTGIDVVLDSEGKVIGGTLAYYSEDVIADGYELNENGEVVESAPAVTPVASVNGVEYTSLEDAITAAQDGDTIVLLDDIELTETVTVFAGKTIVLDLNGKTVTGRDDVTYGDLAVAGTASLTITDSSTSANGKFDGVLLNYGTLTIAGGTVTSDSSSTEGIGGTIVCQPDDQGNLPKLNITGGTVSYTGNATLGMAIYAYETNARVSELNISGGTITSTGVCVMAQATGSITGGIFTGKNLTDIGLENITLSGGAAISGGTFNTDVSKYLAEGYELKTNDDGTYGVAVDPVYGKVAMIGDTYYESLAEALAAAQDGDTIVLLADAAPALSRQRAITAASVIDLNGNTLTLNEYDLYFGTTTFKNGTIVVAPNETKDSGTAVFWMFEGQTLTFDNVEVIATGFKGNYLMGTNGGTGANINLTNGSQITIENTAMTTLTAVIAGNSTNDQIVIENSTINVSNIEGRVALGGCYTVNNSTINANGVKEGFYLRANQSLSIEGTSNVEIVLNDTNGRYGINVTDMSATYTVADTATVTATVYEITPVAMIGTTKYASLQAAIEAAQNGAEIDIISDIELTAQNIQELMKPAYNRESYAGLVIPDDKTIVLDLNGHTVSYVDTYGDIDNVMILNLGNLTINDSIGGGKITYKPVAGTTTYSKFYSTIFNCGTLTINAGTIENTAEAETDVTNAVDNHSRLSHEYGNDCILVVNGGNLEGAYYYAIRQYTHYLEGVQNRVTINGGTIAGGIYMQHGDSWYYANPEANRLDVDCYLTINGGTITVNNTSDAFGKIKSRLSNPDNSVFGLEINGGTIEVPVELLVQRGVYYINGVSGATTSAESAGTRNGEWLEANGGFITGGTFTDAGTAGSTTDLKQFIAAGFELKANGNGTYGVVVNPAYGKVAKIGDTYYATIAEAIAAAQAGDEIVLLADVAEDITVPAGVIFNGNGKQVGNIIAIGDITFKGHTKALDFDFEYSNSTVNIGEGACLELTGTNRLVIGHGCTFNITGTITDAKTANVADITPSLIMPGASFTGAGVTFNVTNAYIKTTASYCSTSGSANGTFDFNIENSIWEQFGKLAFEYSSTAATINFDLKDSVLTTTSHLVFGCRGETVIDNSNVNVGTSRQIENRSTMTIKNGSVVNGAVATSSNAINPGTIIVEDATYAVTGQFSGAAEGTGTLIIKKGATVSVGSIADKANIVIDATGMTAGDEVNFTGDLSKFTGTIEVVNNSNLEAKIVDGKIVLAVKPVASIGGVTYATIAEAIAAAKAGETVKVFAGTYTLPSLKAGITIEGEVNADGTPAVLFEGTLSGTLENLTMKNIHIKGANAQRWAYAKGDLVFENCIFEATSVYALHFDGITEGATLLYKDCTIIGWAAMSGSPASCKFVGCTIKDNGSYGVIRTYFDATIEDCTFDVDNANLTDVYQDGIHAVGGAKLVVDDCTNANGDMKDLVNISGSSVVVLDGVEIKNVAKIGDRYYATIAEAIDAAQAGETIVLLTDVELDAPITVPAGKSVEIGLGDFNITYTSDVMGEAMITNNGELTISGNGKVVYTYTGAADSAYGKGNYTIANNGKLTIDGVTIENATASMKHAFYAITNGNGGEIIMKDGLVLNTNNYAVRMFGKGSLTVDGGEIKGTRAVWMQAPGSNTADAPAIALTVNGGKLTATGESGGYKLAVYSYTYGNSLENVSITVNGGELDGDIALSGGTNKTVAEKVTITGGTITDLYSYAADEVASKTVNVSGGTFKNAIAEAYCAEGFIPTANADGTYGVKEGEYVAQIDTTKYESLADAFAAAQADDEVEILVAGTYALSTSGKNITITGKVEGVVFDNIGAKNMGGANVTFNNVTFDYYPNVNYTGLQHSGNLVYNNCIINGQVFLYGTSETFNKCTFNQNSADAYNVWTYGAKEVEFNECIFNSAGKSVLIYSEQSDLVNDVTVTKSTFTASAAVDGKAAIEMDSSLTSGINLTIDGATTATGFGSGNVSGNSLWNNKKGSNTDANNDITVKVGDETVLAPVKFVAKIGDIGYTSIADAIDAAQAGDTITLICDIVTSEGITNTKKVTLDLNGKTITGTDNSTASFGLITNKGELTITGNGTITLTATNDRDWNAYSSVISNQVGGKLIVENGTIEHLGGTDMAYGIDNLTNGKGTYAETVINGGTVKSTYRAIRMFLNGVEAQNILTVNGGTIEGTNKSIWMQDPSKNANTGKLTVGANAVINGDVYLYVTEGSTEWPVEVSIAADALADGSSVVTGNVPLGYYVENVGGTYGVEKVTLNGSGTVDDPYEISTLKELIFFRDSVNAGETKYNAAGVYVALGADIDMAGIDWSVNIGDDCNATFDGIFDGKGHTIKNLTSTETAQKADGYICTGLFGAIYGSAQIKNLTIENVNINAEFKGNNVGAVVGFVYEGNGAVIENVKVIGNININAPEAYGVGAIVGYAYYGNSLTIKNCYVEGTTGSAITASSAASGIIGYSSSYGLTVEGCTVKGVALNATAIAGGLAGVVTGGTFTDNTVENVTLTVDGANWKNSAAIAVGTLASTSVTVSGTTYSNVNVTDIVGSQYAEQPTAPVAKVPAKIGDTYYTTFNAALAAAKDGDTVTLLENLTINALVKIEKAITLDLNGKKVTSTAKKAFEIYADAEIKNGTIEAANRCVDTREAVELTLTDVTLIADEYTAHGNPQPLTIGGSENGTKVTMTNVTINAGTAGYGIITFVKTELTATNSTISGYNALYVKPGSEGSVFNFINSDLTGSTGDNDVEGNSFSTIAVRADDVTVNVDADSTISANGNYYWAISLDSKFTGENGITGADITVAGTINGQILTSVDASENTISVKAEYADELKAEGYVVSNAVNGMITVEGEAVAEVNGVAYATLAEALAAAKSIQENVTIKLMSDCEETLVAVNSNVILDLNGNTLTAYYAVGFKGSNIIDSSADNSGRLKTENAVFAENNAQLPVKTADGYAFAEYVDNIRSSKRLESNGSVTYAFKLADIEADLLDDIMNADSAVTFEVRLSWTTTEYSTNQDFVYNNTMVSRVLNSYNSGNFSQVFTVNLNEVWIASANQMKISFVVKSNNVVIYSSSVEDVK